MKKMTNEVFIQGYLYNHTLKMQKVKDTKSKNFGKPFIRGDIMIAVDEEMTNVISIRYNFETQTIGKGEKEKPNSNWPILNNIIEGKILTVMGSDKEKAAKIRVKSAIGLNDFPDKNTHEMVSYKVNRGGFITLVAELPDEKQRNNFNCDFVITGVKRIEANEERNLPEKMTLKGCVFDFKQSILPVEFAVLNPKAMDYFESLDISKKNPCFTRVQGKQISQTVTKRYEEESAFGEPIVRETKSSYKDYVVTWALPEEYAWDSPETILASELTEKIQEREIYLASEKERQENWNTNRAPGDTEEKDDNLFDF